ncbi:hypothetical protein HYPGJ_30463 [Hyphomicrobium sp. GJ21]|nr:hypothetical protein HYPGJ_30463 [Hyphomicrobium sp. GJ21]
MSVRKRRFSRYYSNFSKLFTRFHPSAAILIARREGATPAYGSKSSQPFTSVVALNGD